MAGATWDMITDGPDAGTVIQPLQYTADEDQATRVKLWVSLATPLGSYVYKTPDGLDHELMLDPSTSDEDRQEAVREVLLANDQVADVAEVVATQDLEADVPTVTIAATYTTVTGATQALGFTI